ncbi:hypothetical protein DMN91_002328 [Ooceraea biroi]|uniref:RanBD1 domain-containing protein n=1 Tax=Ooceraea biroi TaxID=2015173 RepID=A0A3L8E0W3_OOCBI|nr:ran-binding protein 3 [Ooceraea biroi]XP_011352137.2 ran-binding protein 3 [Ooceraea biroi]RLU26162.1 hypothetical protein DMN91_002328 [Ooceraea biroi]
MADCKEDTEGVDRPPLVLKIDPPEESPKENTEETSTNDKSAVSSDQDETTSHSHSQATESNDQASASTIVVKPLNKKHYSLLAASKFGHSFGFNDLSGNSVTQSSKAKSSILRPSQLSAVTNSCASPDKSVLQPAKFHNPFTKVIDDSIEEEEEENNESETRNDKAVDESMNEEKLVEEDAKPTVFLPLGVSAKENENSINNTVASSTSTPSFVFGQNLKERVTVSNDIDDTLENSDKDEAKKSEETNENGSSELLFSNAAANCRSTVRPGLTLTQAAQVLEEANRANKRKYNQVTPLTGEEGETNVLQINCKLFAFDKTSSSWQERGRGTLRLNDRDEESRLVGRTAGTQRLILNTKVWPGMTAERAGPKSLRLTAMDVHGDIRIFIVQAAPKEVDQLHNLLLQRLKRAQERHPKKLATDH